MWKTSRTIAVLALGAGVALTPLTAQAQQTRVHDGWGDSTSRAVDITRLRVRHAEHRISGTVTIPRLKPGRLSGTELLIKPKGKKKVYAVTVLRDRGGRVAETSLSWRPLNDPIEPEMLSCNRIRTSLRAEQTVVSVAKKCLTKSRANQPVKAKVRTVDGTTGLEGAYYNDQTRFSRLLERGQADSGAAGKVTAHNGLVVRRLPTTFSARQGKLEHGKVSRLTCQVTGSVVYRDNDENGDVSNLWYRLPGKQRWVSSLYIRNINGTPPYCGTGKTYHGRVTAKLLVPREAPTTRASSHGGLPRGSRVKINCKLHGREVGGNDIWYNMPRGLWVPAKHVSIIGTAPGYCTG